METVIPRKSAEARVVQAAKVCGESGEIQTSLVKYAQKGRMMGRLTK